MTQSAELSSHRELGAGRNGPESQLGRVEARLERIESMLARFEHLADQAPGLVGMTGDIADEWARRDGHADARLQALFSLLDRVTRPEVLGALQTMVAQLEAAPGLLAMTGDIVDEFARHAQAEGADLQRATANLGTTLKALVRALGDPETKDFLETGALSGPALHTINAAARSLVAARDAEPQRAGFFAAMARMRDPDVQRAVGFLLTAAKSFGAHLDDIDQTARRE